MKLLLLNGRRKRYVVVTHPRLYTTSDSTTVVAAETLPNAAVAVIGFFEHTLAAMKELLCSFDQMNFQGST